MRVQMNTNYCRKLKEANHVKDKSEDPQCLPEWRT